MLKKKWFWVLFTLLFVAATWYSYAHFDKIGDIIDIDIRMSREEAVEKALQLAAANGWGPEDPGEAVQFYRDGYVQTYVELEGGGKERFKELIKENIYEPYQWRVRLFKENTPHEVMVAFTPEGAFYQFKEKIPEDEKGPVLLKAQALALVQKTIADWNINLQDYLLVEHSVEIKPSGRGDHTLEYEHADKQINDAFYRYSFRVSGDRVTAITNYIKVPEGFARTYAEMRSKNSTLGTMATVLAATLYFLLGTCAVLILFSKKNKLSWKKELIIGFSISFFTNFLSHLNEIPFLWNYYDTALSPGSFLIRQLTAGLTQFLIMGGLISLTLVAANALTREAFPKKIQFLKSWSSRTGASAPVLHFTVLGLFLVSFFVGYQILFQSLAHHWPGWWSPSFSWMDPNILASYFPWFNPIMRALQAGFWEECMFRAIPLGGAVLLGRRYGRGKVWVIGALILQALIFGAAHAGYAQQPYFARVVELFIPAVIFGLLYLAYGLLPGIVMHFAYDAVLMATPLFVSSSKSLLIGKVIAVLLILFPLLILLYRRIHNKGVYSLQKEDLNEGWSPELAKEEKEPVIRKKNFTPAFFRGILVSGLLGLFLWIFLAPKSADVPFLEIKRREAVRRAHQVLAEENIELSSEWKALTRMNAEKDIRDKFVWETGGKELYHRLIGDYLSGPEWIVRFARFTGDVKERKEEYRVRVSGQGDARLLYHAIPEHWEGAVLDEDEAKRKADEILTSALGRNPEEMVLIRSEPKKMPDRTDWVIEYKEPFSDLPQGELRNYIALSGDKLSHAASYVFLPESWLRENRNKENSKGLVQTAGMLSLFFFIGVAVVMALKKWKKGKIHIGLFRGTALFFSLLIIGKMILTTPKTFFSFSTSAPFESQLFIAYAMEVILLMLGAFLLGLIAAAFGKGLQNEGKRALAKDFFTGNALALTGWGLATAVSLIAGRTSALWPDLKDLNTLSPFISTAVNTLIMWTVCYVFLSFLVRWVETITRNGERRKGVALLIFLLAGFALSAVTGRTAPLEAVGTTLIAGLFLYLLFMLVFVRRTAMIPFLTAGLIVLPLIGQMFYHSYPGAIGDHVMAALIVFAVSGFVHKKYVNSLTV